MKKLIIIVFVLLIVFLGFRYVKNNTFQPTTPDTEFPNNTQNNTATGTDQNSGGTSGRNQGTKPTPNPTPINPKPETPVVTTPFTSGVTINLGSLSNSTLKQGIVNGPSVYTGRTAISDKADALMSQLKFTSWRFSGINGFGYGGNIYKMLVEDYHYDTRFGTHMVLNLQDTFNAIHGKPIKVKASCEASDPSCFTSFESLRATWNSEGQVYLNATKNAHVTYYDIFSEPDLGSFVNVSPEELYILMTDAFKAVRQMRPDVKIVVPSNSGLNVGVYTQLIQRLIKDGLHPDAISWHNFDSNPETILEDVAVMKQIFSANPGICNPSCPQMHMNEYQGEASVFIPGDTVAWLYNLEKAGVNEANRSCWGGDPGALINYESCWNGFSGMLTPDYTTPQPLYWIYKNYADLNGSRYATQSTVSKITSIAGNLGGGKVGVLIGNYGDSQGALQVKLDNYRSSKATIELYKLANAQQNKITPMPQMPLIKSLTATASNGSLVFPLENSFAKGDAYWVVVTPN